MSSPEKINVLYLIWTLEMGGAEHVVVNLARGLDRTRFTPMVCCLNWKGRLAEELEREGIRVVALEKSSRWDLRVVGKLVGLLRRERIHILHTHLWSASFWGRIAARLARVPVVVITEHNVDTWRNRFHLLADQWLSRRTDRLIFVSQVVQEFYRQQLVLPLEKCQVVYNGIDLEACRVNGHAAEVRASWGIPAGARVVGTIGRLAERKGHRFFIEAMRTVAATSPNVVGVIVGEGRIRDELAAAIEAAGLRETVRLVGYCPEIAQALSALDLFVLPSLMEGFPLAILEAMAAGKPVVATDVGGTVETMEPGRTGLLVPPANSQALAEAILSLLNDPARAVRMGQAGRARAEERFSLPAMIRETQTLYLDTIAHASGGRRHAA